MDATRFDQLARALASAGPRRGLLRFLTALPLPGGLAALWGEEEAAAKGRRKRRRKRHKHGQNRPKNRRKRKTRNKKQRCRPKSRAKVCAGKCGVVKNQKTCKKKIDCGPCACDPPCPACQVCNETTGVCEPDPNQQGDACGDPGQVCQDNGTCACDASSCEGCRTCQGNGTCSEPICQNPKPICVNNTCTACSQANPCPSGQYCRDDSCQVCDVCPGGDCPFDSVQAAIDDASDGDTIQICPGTYGRIRMVLNKNLTLIGAGEGDNPAADTILDGARGRVVLVAPIATATLQRLRITGGSRGVVNAGTTQLTSCTIAGNNASPEAGAGVYNNLGGKLTLTNCTVINNLARRGAGLLQNGGPLTLENTVVTLNTANSGDGNGNGGGILAGGGVVNVIDGSVITENSTDGRGGGVFATNPNSTVNFDNTASVTKNKAGANLGGGGIYNNGASIVLNGATVKDNTPTNCSGFPVAGCSG